MMNKSICEENIEHIEEEALVEKIGVVVNCSLLNIRKEPSMNADVIVLASVHDELRINESISTDEWFAVCTASGVEGFCMKKFVDIRQ